MRTIARDALFIPARGLATIPELLWELLLGLYLTVKGFRAAAILTGTRTPDVVPA